MKSLRVLRDESGLTLYEILDKMREVMPETPKVHTWLIHIEKRGTDRLPILRALSHAYGLPLEEVEKSAKPSSGEINCTELVNYH